MAKTKISELEKMYSADRKEIIAFLNEKGIEAKTANSSVDEKAAAMVAERFAKAEKKTESKAAGAVNKAAEAAAKAAETTNKAAEAPVKKAPVKAAENTASAQEQAAQKKTEPAAARKEDNVEQKTEAAQPAAESAQPQKPEKTEKPENGRTQAQAKAPQGQQGAPRKKKIIIVTNGNQGRSQQGGRTGAYSTGSAPQRGAGARPQRSGGGQRPGAGDRSRADRGGRSDRRGGRMEAQTMYRPIKPQIVPSQMEVDYHKPVPQPSRPKPEEPVKPQMSEQAQSAENSAALNRSAAAQNAEAGRETAQSQSAAQSAAQNQNAPETARRGETAGHAPQQDGQRPAAGAGRPQGGRPAQGERAQNQGGRSYSSDRGERRTSFAGSQQGGYGQNRGGQGRPGQGSYGQNRGGQQGGGYGQSRPGAGRPGQGGYGQNRGGQQGGGYGQSRPGAGRPGAGRPGQGGRPAFGDNRNRRSAGPGRPAPGGEPFVKDAEKHRDENRRKQGQERDKRSRKDLIYTEDEKNRKNRPGRFIRPEKKADEPAEEKIKVIALPEKLTIRELAEKMHMQPAEIIKKLFLQGQVMTVNSELTYEEAENIAIDYDIICEKEVKVDAIEELLKEDEDREEDLRPRPPVICVMGHVDHGKTSLLDAIRKTNVTDKEAGGITQHIGAYTVTAKGREITFLDTPGHEAFTAMRMRGANSTDIAVLVVAADDGVMPQTIEAINHAKAAGIEIIVAVNKVDKPNANVDRVKQELTEYGLVATDWGGSTEFVPVSAKNGQGIDTLLETILLTADILELKANPNRRARGLVLEAKLDKGRGPVANVLVQKGTLHVGDFISAGEASGKVRAMVDDKGRRVKEAGPSIPVEILGLSSVPGAGEVILAHADDKTAKSYAATYKTQHKENLIEETRMRMSLDDLFTQMKEGNLKEFDIIIKADVQGSVEALRQSLLKLSNDEVVVKVIHGGVGAITESDVTLAAASNAIIMGFNVRPDAAVKAMAEHEGVDVRLYKVIYQAIDDVEAALKGMLAPVYEEKVIGHAEVRQIFRASAIGNIAGSFVTDGVFRRGCKIRIRRGDEQIYEGALASLKRFKDDVKEVKEGYECGLVFEGFDKMQELDVVEAYEMVEVPRT